MILVFLLEPPLCLSHRQTEIALNMWNKVKSLSIPVPDQNGVWKREKDDSSDDEESAMPKKQKVDST